MFCKSDKSVLLCLYDFFLNDNSLNMQLSVHYRNASIIKGGLKENEGYKKVYCHTYVCCICFDGLSCTAR